ncbi:unnamed protein product, partial [marine sediment metagenome]
LPWRDIPYDEVADLPAEIDPAYVTLRAIEWNQDRLEKGFSPYSSNILAYILSGNTYAATQFIEDPIQRGKRKNRLEASPYFAVLQSLRGSDKTIHRIIDRLLGEEFTYIESITFDKDGGGEITYETPLLTEKGKSQVQSGQYINMELQ